MIWPGVALLLGGGRWQWSLVSLTCRFTALRGLTVVYDGQSSTTRQSTTIMREPLTARVPPVTYPTPAPVVTGGQGAPAHVRRDKIISIKAPGRLILTEMARAFSFSENKPQPGFSARW